MVDTGAQKTVIDRGIAESLGIVPIRFEEMTGVSHVPENCPVYLLSITLVVGDGTKKRGITFTSEMIGMATPPNPRPFNGLLGRDFFRFVRLIYDGSGAYCDIIPVIPEPPSKRSVNTGGHKPDRRDRRKAEREARRKNRR
ncbi:MAG: hypothetical protein KIT79_12680 [Deltaproteobacteria bacterium]|nr:hypothetical protein [Deltaproteobacteria bacterium]